MKKRWKKLMAAFLCGAVLCTDTGFTQAVLAAEAGEAATAEKMTEETETQEDRANAEEVKGEGTEAEEAETGGTGAGTPQAGDTGQESEDGALSASDDSGEYDREPDTVDGSGDVILSGNCGDAGENVKYVLDSSGVLTISGSGDMASYNGWSSAAPWYEKKMSLKTVVVESGVTSIGDYAFWGCNCSESIKIPSSVERIGNYAFGYSSLTSIEIPSGVTSIGSSVFYNCSGLTSIKIPSGVTSIGDFVFYNCSGLTSIKIPSGVTSIGDRVFEGCTGLTSAGPTGGNYAYEFEWEETIPAHAFSGCSGLTSINIPSGVTSIGDGAFGYCSGLTSIDIPSGVTSIGDGAFAGCSGLTSIKIPSGMTCIEGGVFARCSGLTSVDIPSGVTSIEYGAFADCSGLTSVDIPSGVTSIAGGVFAGCSSLTSVNIPSGVTSIELEAFRGCRGLTSIDIPSSVKVIKEYAFADCGNLTSVNIPFGVTSIGGGAFSRCRSLTSISIPLSVGGIGYKEFEYCDALTSIEILNPACNIYDKAEALPGNASIYGYAGSTAQSYAKKYNRIFISLGVAPRGKYQFHVVDQNGNSLSGVQVTYDKQSQKTGRDGLATFDLFTAGIPSVSAALDGYITWSNASSSWEKSDTHYETIVLYEESVGRYRLSSCRYSNSQNMGHSTDLLTRTKTVSLGNDLPLAGDMDFGNFYIACHANTEDGVARYELWQGKEKIADAANGTFPRLSTDSFKEGAGCFVRVVANTGETVDTAVNLKFKKQEINKDTEFSFDGDSVKFEVADDVPFIGGSEFEFKMPISMPVTYQITEDKIQVGLNVDLAGGESEKEQLKEARALIRSAKKAGNMDVGEKLTQSQEKIFKALIKKKNGWTFFKDGEINVLGYLEADLGSSTAKGHIMLQGKIDPVRFGYTAWVVIAPVTANIKLSLETGVIGEVSYDWKNATLLGMVDINGSAELKAFGGVGVSTFIGAGAYGSAKLEGLVRVLGTPQGLQSVKLTGELGLEGYLGAHTYKRPFAHNTWSLYTANTVQGLSSDSGGSWTDGIYDADAYRPHDLNYLSEESEWIDTPALYARTASSGGVVSLLKDTYRNAQPTMAAGRDGIYAAFLRADADTGHVYTAVTKYNGANWVDPMRADDTAVLDGSPALCVDESGTVWLAYTRTTGGNGDSSFLEYAKNQSIVVGSIDPATLKFKEEKVYPGQSYAHTPQMALIKGIPTLVWLDSDVTDDDSVLYPASGRVCTAACENGVWGEARALGEVDKPVGSFSVGDKGGTLAVAYTADADGSYHTVEDQNLYCLTGGEHTLLAEGVQGHVKFGTLPGTDGADFIWNADGCLVAAGGAQVEAEGISGEYVLTGDRIYYSAAGEQGAQLTELLYTDGRWSSPVVLDTNEEGRYLEDLSVVRWKDTDYALGMNTQVKISAENVEDAKNLVWMAVGPVSDLKLEAADYNADGLAAGEEMQVTLTVTNGSDHTVNSITAGWNVQEGASPAEKTVNSTLLPGETADIDLTLACPEKVTNYTFTVSEAGQADQDLRDNTVSISLGYPDLAVRLEERQIGQSRGLAAVVTNEGVMSASGRIQFSDMSGNILKENTFEALAPGDRLIFTCDSQVEDGDYTATILCDSEDLYTDNNTDTIHAGTGWTEESPQIYITGPVMADCIYTAAAISPQGTPKAELADGTDITDSLVFTYSYKGTMADGSVYGPSAQPPVNAGSYTLTVSVAENEEGYGGTKEYPFTIAKAGLKITAENKTVRAGDVLPEKYACRTEGLLGNDKLEAEPYVTCTAENTSVAGEYRLIPSNADAGMNYDINYVEGKLTVVADSEEKAYTVTFQMNGYGAAPEKYTAVKPGDTIKEPAAPTADGHVFTGWYKEAECRTRWDFAKDVVTENTTLYAGWEEEKGSEPGETTYTVKFDLQGRGSKEDITVVSGNKIEEPTAPTATGYTFTGWYKEAECRTRWDFATDVVTKDTTLYAGWQEIFGDVLPEDVPQDKVIPRGLWAAAVQDMPYTGKAVKPEVHVYWNSIRLDEKLDYTVKYKNNKKVNTISGAGGAPAVMITGKKHYPGSYPVYFNITPIDLEDVTADNMAVAYNGKVQRKIPTLYWNGKKLVNKKDFTVSYPNGADAYQEEGDYEILVTAKNGGNFTGEKTIRLSIVNPDDYKLISKAAVKKIPVQQYTGGPIELDSDELKVTFKGVGTLLEGEDYDVKYENNTAVGTATALIQGTGGYVGTKRVTFQIKGRSLKKPFITGFTLQKSMVYNGEEQEQDTSQMKVAVNGDSLTEGTDYEILYSNNKNAGKAIFTIQGVNEYAGTVKKSFKITAYDLKKDSDHMIKGLEEAVTEKLTSGRAAPKPQLTFGNKTLVEGRDYTVSYKNNRKAAAADDEKAPTIIIKGKGNFKGTITKTFTITE